MSAEQHEAAARADKAEARAHADRYDPMAIRYAELYPEQPLGCDRTMSANCSPLWTMTVNPTDRELSEAAAHLARARRHRAAARALRDAEAKACAGVSPADRDMSPFHRHRDIRQVEEMGLSAGRGPVGAPAGAAVLFASVPGLTADSLQKIVDCHLARNAALGFDQSEGEDCPLNVKGASGKVRATPEGLVVEVTATDAAAALEIVKRARALASPSPLSSQCCQPR